MTHAGDVLGLCVLALASVGVWRLMSGFRLLPEGGVDAGSGPAVHVVVPARDEEATLPDLLSSVRASTYPAAVVVIDDDSRDHTAAVAGAGGARVIVSDGPPTGWTGKAWSCHLGAADHGDGAASDDDVLVFLDADTRLTADAMERLVCAVREHGGLISVQPFHRAERVHEQFSAYFNVVSVLASAVFTTGRARRATAFGPCLATTRGDYRTAGGHGAVRAEILDDVALARAYERAGLPTTCFAGGRELWMRSYPEGFDQFAAGWTKNMAAGAAGADPWSRLITVAWIAGHHVVAVGALGATLAAAISSTPAGSWSGLSWPEPSWFGLWWCAWTVCAAQLWWLLRGLGSFRWWTWALFPVPLVVFDALFAVSLFHTVARRRVHWRSRPVTLSPR